MRHLLAIEDLERAADRARSSTAPRASPRSAAATSRRCRPCAGAPSSASSTSRAPAPAPPSSSPPSGSRPTSSRSRRPAPSVDKGESLKDTIATLSAYEPGGDRHPLTPRRRRRAGHRAGPTPRSSTPATASTSTRARRCSTSTRCVDAAGLARGQADLDRRRRPPQPRRPLLRCSPSARWAPR